MATRGEAVIQPSRVRVGQGRPAVEAPEVTTAPELGVLDRRHLRERKQRRQARALVAISVLCVGASLLLAAVGHAIVASDQIRSDALQGEVATQLAAAQNYQLQRAELESPVRIESIAENQLYMVMPSAVTYVVPVKTGETVAEAHSNPTSPVLRSEVSPARLPTVRGRQGTFKGGRGSPGGARGVARRPLRSSLAR
jgi:cell division protein FtsB